MNISIIALTPADVQAFKTIRLNALKAHPGVYSGKYEDAVTWPDSEWLGELDQKGKCIFGLYDDEKIIGITAVFTWREDPTKESGILAMSYIEPDYRNRGLSRHFYEARIHWALQHLPWKKLVVSHRDGNEPSRRAMLAHGFEFTHKTRKVWPDSIEADEYHYMIDLEKLRRAEQ